MKHLNLEPSLTWNEVMSSMSPLPSREDRESLAGRVAVVTGGSTGIGAAICRHLALAGATVIVDHLAQDRDANALVEAIHGLGGIAHPIDADVTDASAVEHLRDETLARFGHIDILVNNAGAYPRISWATVSLDDWDRQLSTNLTAHFLCARLLSPALIESRHGTIINISSVLAFVGRIDLVPYIAAKAGLVGLTKALAREMGPRGVRVNCVACGSIEVEAERQLTSDYGAMLQRQLERQCLKRRGRPDDVAQAVVFLAGDQSSFITGQTLVVDGGWFLH